ncbi:MAG TPA: LPS assembly protein LptD, partial [Candidatus Binatia bacterium]|nr:LPS assembly protein LptD [Candidatus Binatia bacterium]
DRTPGAKPATAPGGAASSGETFTGELTLLLRGFTLERPAAIEVADPLVTSVRLFPEPDGATVTVFVRQPVTYTVARPSGAGDVRIELHGKTRSLTVTGVTPEGRLRVAPLKPTGEHETAVDAESLSYDRATNTLTARGSVTLTRGDSTLTADEVVYDRTNGIAEAHGHVVLTDPHATVAGDFAHLNMEDETGWVEDADTTFHLSRFNARGTRIDKLGGPRYSVANGIFTTCECGGLERPSWSIAGDRTDITLQGTGLVHSMTFRVKDVPVFYLPAMLFPANSQRQSGFLIPRLGYSNRRGFQYEQPFFWAIDKSSDATIATDLETAARVGIIGEYRYALSRTVHGEFSAAYYNEAIRGSTAGTIGPGNQPVDIPENRFAFTGHHVQPFYGGSRFYLDLFAVSDLVFLREINTFAASQRYDLTLRTTRFTTSKAGLYKGWGEGYANGEVAWYQDLIDPQELTLQKLPRVDAEHSMSLLDDHAVARVAGQAIDYQRDNGYDGVRGDLAPDLFLPFHLGHALQGSLTGQVRETAYHLTDTQQVAFAVPDCQPNGKLPNGKPCNFPDTQFQSGFTTAPRFALSDLATDHTRELADVQGQVGTGFERVYDFKHLGLDKLKHTLEPEVQYLFVPPLDRSFDSANTTVDCGKLIGGTPGRRCHVQLFGAGYLFDERDAINRRNFVSWGITSRLLGRAATPPPPAVPPPAGAQETAPIMSAVDPETLPQGLPAAAVPDVVRPPAAGGAPAPAAAPRELVRAAILHGYDISRPLVEESHASDVDLGLRLTPLDWLGISSSATVSAEEKRLRGVTIGVLAREAHWTPPDPIHNFQSPATAAISYRFIDQNVNQSLSAQGPTESLLFRGDGVSELDGSLYVHLGRYLGFTFLSRYSFNGEPVVNSQGAAVLGANGLQETTGPHFLERDYLLRLVSRCNCWVLEAGVSDKFNPDERLFRVQLTLIGLGSFGQSPFNRAFVGFSPLTPLNEHGPGFGRGGVY